MTPALACTGLDAGYVPGRPVVRGFDLSAEPGEIVALLGPNGAGKTTLLMTIAGLLPALGGSVEIAGHATKKGSARAAVKAGLVLVPDDRSLFKGLTVTENLEMGSYLLSKPQLAARTDKVLSTFPALADMRSRTASKLSGGERKMLAVARVLMLEPAVLVLDEPTSNLSPELSRSVLRDQVRRLADSGTAVLLVEQKAFEALGVSDWAYILVAGRVEIAGPAKRPILTRLFAGEMLPANRARSSGARPTAPDRPPKKLLVLANCVPICIMRSSRRLRPLGREQWGVRLEVSLRRRPGRVDPAIPRTGPRPSCGGSVLVPMGLEAY